MALKPPGSKIRPEAFIRALEVNPVIRFDPDSQQDAHEYAVRLDHAIEQAFKFSVNGDRSDELARFSYEYFHTPDSDRPPPRLSPVPVSL